jgi:hypothetical protein
MALFYQHFSGAYEIWQFRLAEGVDAKSLSSALSKLEVPSENSVLCGAFSSLFGPANSAVLLWRHKSLDVANELRVQWDEFAKSN